MRLIYLLMLMMMIPSASAVVLNETNETNETKIIPNEKGIVLDANDIVLYKYDTPAAPTLRPGEYIVLYEDIDSVLTGAKYDGVSFVNPVPVEIVRYEEKLVAVSATGLDPVTQAAISAATGAGAAYLVIRRKKA